MASAEIHLTIMAAEELKSNKRLGKMSVYTVVWLDPAMKQSTRVLRKGGTNPVWNHEITFSLGENVLIYPHSTLTLEVMSQGKVRDTLIGTTYLPLAEIARMKALNGDPEECDIVSLPLHRPSGRPQGYIRLSIIVKDKNQGLHTPGMSASAPGSVEEPVMGYPVELPSNMAYYSAPAYTSTSSQFDQQGSSSTYNLQGQSSGHDSRAWERFPFPSQPTGVPPEQYYTPANIPSPYVQPPQAYIPMMQRRATGHNNRNFMLALVGGSLGGLLLGEIMGGVL